MKYRMPTSILWENNGFREFEATSIEDAMNTYKFLYPNSAQNVTVLNLQVHDGTSWVFAIRTN